jgi:hypothetical protein
MNRTYMVLKELREKVAEAQDLLNHTAATTSVHGATSAATPNTIVQRDSAGRAKFAAPAESDDAARKAEVDAAQGTANAAQSAINDHVARTDNPHGTTAAQVGAPSLTIVIPNGVSLNTVVTSGFYRLSESHPDAPPGTGYGQMIVSRGGDTVLQIVTGFNYSNFYMRHGNPPEAGGAGVWQPWRKLWHDGNDGAGSGLDADTVRGYIPANKAGDTFTDDVIIDRGRNAGYTTLRIRNTTQVIDFGSFWQEGVTQFSQIQTGDAITGGPTLLRINPNGGMVTINDFPAWHAGNDGHGSGLDADLLDGLHASSFWTKSEIPYETGNWTPNVEIGGILASYASRSGTYIRIRDLVYWTFNIELSSKNGGTGSIAIGAFPFPIGPTNGIIPMGKITSAAFPSGVYWAHLLVPWNGATFFYLMASGSISGNYFLTGNHISDNSILAASGVCRI